MTLPLSITALLLLSLFSAMVHATQMEWRRSSVGVCVASASLTLLVMQWWPAQPATGGVLIAGFAIWSSLRPLSSPVRGALTGISLAQACAVLIDQGLPWWLALSLSAALLFWNWRSGRQQYFAPPVVQQQALLGLAWSGLCLAALPAVLSGWQSAQTLNIQVESSTPAAIPAWAWQFVLAALVLGLVRGIWGRR